jgi:aminoglycoside phosphotransferase (APT) family kinase protein
MRPRLDGGTLSGPVTKRRRPDEDVASDIVMLFCGRKPDHIQRFATGIGHWVYDVRHSGGEQVVVRIGTPDQAEDFAGAVHWSRLLRPIGVPLPSLLGAGTHQQFPYVLLERLPGEDLGLAYDNLDVEQKKAIAGQICDVQRLAASLGLGWGYGYVKLPDATRRSSWRHVIDDSIRRSHSRLKSVNALDSSAISRVTSKAAQLDGYFSRVRPTPFLDDVTTKNVIVHDGKLSGIVDVDWICFGDPLFTVALTRASLLSSGRDLSYTDHWCHLLALSSEEHAALQFYTGLFFLDFMSELGQRFNRDTPTVTVQEVERLEILLEEQLRWVD